MFNELEKKEILKKIPEFNLKEEKIIYKKVFNVIDYYFLIPNGKRNLLWFTHYKKQFLPVLLILNKNEIIDLQILSCCFSEELALNNTIFLCYSFFKKENKNLFLSLYDIIFYKGKLEYNNNFENKLIIFKDFFENNIKQILFHKNSVIIGLPKIINSIKNLENEFYNTIYDTNSIIYIQKNKSEIYGKSYFYINNIIYGHFSIKADFQDDIYNIYLKNENYIYDILLIDSYKTSVFMNSLFRNIKENKNLDLLEESDSETEFENIDHNKYVNFNKKYVIKCKYNSKFKKWIPIELSNESPFSRKTLYEILKK